MKGLVTALLFCWISYSIQAPVPMYKLWKKAKAKEVAGHSSHSGYDTHEALDTSHSSSAGEKDFDLNAEPKIGMTDEMITDYLKHIDTNVEPHEYLVAIKPMQDYITNTNGFHKVLKEYLKTNKKSKNFIKEVLQLSKTDMMSSKDHGKSVDEQWLSKPLPKRRPTKDTPARQGEREEVDRFRTFDQTLKDHGIYTNPSKAEDLELMTRFMVEGFADKRLITNQLRTYLELNNYPLNDIEEAIKVRTAYNKKIGQARRDRRKTSSKKHGSDEASEEQYVQHFGSGLPPLPSSLDGSSSHQAHHHDQMHPQHYNNDYASFSYQDHQNYDYPHHQFSNVPDHQNHQGYNYYPDHQATHSSSFQDHQWQPAHQPQNDVSADDIMHNLDQNNQDWWRHQGSP